MDSHSLADDGKICVFMQACSVGNFPFENVLFFVEFSVKSYVGRNFLSWYDFVYRYYVRGWLTMIRTRPHSHNGQISAISFHPGKGGGY